MYFCDSLCELDPRKSFCTDICSGSNGRRVDPFCNLTYLYVGDYIFDAAPCTIYIKNIAALGMTDNYDLVKSTCGLDDYSKLYNDGYATSCSTNVYPAVIVEKNETTKLIFSDDLRETIEPYLYSVRLDGIRLITLEIGYASGWKSSAVLKTVLPILAITVVLLCYNIFCLEDVESLWKEREE